MFKFIIGAVIVVWLVSSSIGSAVDSHDAEVAQSARNARQAEILVGMETQHDAGVSHLLEEWRQDHAAPTDQDIEELRILAERVKADPASATRYTAEAKQAHLASLPFRPAFGDWSTQHAGLDDPAPAASTAVAAK